MTTDSMQCLICPGDRTVEVTQKPIPEPGPDDVRIRVRGSAICGSDLHKYRQPQAERDEHGYSKLTLGHEGAGVVDAVGPGVTHPAVGDRVVIYHLIGCGHCEHCRRGEPGFCRDMQGFNWVRDGVNADYVVVPARSTLPLPDDFDFEDGALLACNLGTAFAAARKAKASGDMTLAVSGLGPVGLYTVMFARAMGASVIGIDVQPSRIEMAEKLGIDATVNAAEVDPVEAMRAFGGGDGVHAAIDTSGFTQARTAALEGLRPHGIFVEVGIGEETVYKLSAPLNAREITLTGSWIFKLYEWEDLLDFMRRHELPVKDVIAKRIRIDEAVEAFKLADSATTGKIMIDWT